jgi:hypothetical protein
MLPKSFLNNYLLIAFVLAFEVANAQSNCKDIKATIEVFQAGQKAQKASVVIDFHDQPQSSFEVFLLGSKGFAKRDILETEIRDLAKGQYTLVFSSRREEDGYCIKHFEFIIK